jgi:transcriptional adapter 2-alpha
MEFTSDDTEADRELKLDVLRIFNAKLDEREKRKRFIIDRGLLNYRENQEKLWQMAPDERQLVQRMRIFARYQTREEHDAFVDKIIEAKRLRKEISKLQMYRRLGITSLADAEKYEMDKARRELHRSAWMKKEEEKRKAAEEAARVAKEHSTSLGIAPPVSSLVTATPIQVDEAVNAETNQSLQLWRQFKRSAKEIGSESDAEMKDAKFILADKPGFELLTKKEVGLCKRLRLLPQNYLDVKKALISESLARGIWNPKEGGAQNKNKSIFKVDVTQHENIIDFVLEAGWITRPGVHS